MAKSYLQYFRQEIFYTSVGAEHVAQPIGIARVLVMEAEGSVELLFLIFLPTG